MLNKMKTRLEQMGVFNKELSPLMIDLTEVVTGAVAFNMKLSIAASELILFASQFRKYIKLPTDKTPIPINSISFVLASSGANKDRSVKAIRSTFTNSYKRIDIYRKKLASEAAVNAAKAAGVDEPDKWENHKEYYRSPAPLFAALTNQSAYLDHLADIERLSVGAGYCYAGEVGSEMATNADMIPAIRVMSELYDVGYKEAKPLKNKDSQTPEIRNLPVSALFVGSHDNILFDEKIKTLFKTEFTTKLARRSFFTFCPEEIQLPEYEDDEDGYAVDKMIEAEEAEELATMEISARIDEQMLKVVECNLANRNHIVLSEDASKIYKVYTRYNAELSKQIPKKYPISALVRKHNQWKALKLAGALAIIECTNEITKRHLAYAISYIELISPDMSKFEAELVKEKYEVFSDYMQYSAADSGKFSITLHALKKLQYITGTSSTTTRMKELCELASSYDPAGVYTVVDNTIQYERIKKTEVTGASFIIEDYSELAEAYRNGASKDVIRSIKINMAARSLAGYDYQEVDFPMLAGLLNNDVAFGMFEFKTPKTGAVWDKSKNPTLPMDKGVRGRDNVIGGTTWICFDVDDGVSTAAEMHEILSDLNHHIALTSDPSNEYKYRIILQLDAYVTLEPLQWKYFIESISDYLMIPIDSLPQAQIMFGYANREVLSVIDQSPIEVKDHLTYGINKAADKGGKEKELTPKEKAALLDSKFTTFEPAFMCKSGVGSRLLYWAAKKAVKLGMSKDEACDLVSEISDYWESPFPPNRLLSLHNQIRQPNF